MRTSALRATKDTLVTDANRAASQTHDLPREFHEDAEGRARAGLFETRPSPPMRPHCVEQGRRLL